MYFKKIDMNIVKNFIDNLEDKVVIKEFQDNENIVEEITLWGKNLPVQFKKNIRFLEVMYNDILERKVKNVHMLDICDDCREVIVQPTITNDITNKWKELIKNELKNKKENEDFSFLKYESIGNIAWNPIFDLIKSNLTFQLLRKNYHNYHSLILFSKSFSKQDFEKISFKILRHLIYFTTKQMNNGVLFTVISSNKENDSKEIYIKADEITFSAAIDKNDPVIMKLKNDIEVLFKKIQSIPTLYAVKNSAYTKHFVRKLIALTEIV